MCWWFTALFVLIQLAVLWDWVPSGYNMDTNRIVCVWGYRRERGGPQVRKQRTLSQYSKHCTTVWQTPGMHLTKFLWSIVCDGVVLPGEVGVLLIYAPNLFLKTASPAKFPFLNSDVLQTVACKDYYCMFCLSKNGTIDSLFANCHLTSAAWLQGVRRIFMKLTLATTEVPILHQYWPIVKL